MLKQAIIPMIIVVMLATMILPVPALLMDFLIVANLVLALVLLISTLYITEPLRLSSLPTILLLATLFRLALNISTTRLILASGDAGQTVEAFGTIVIQGNLVVGAVIFLIITLVQFIVIAKGSERVAEVSARFSLDAMPGKQMSIDADVRAGLIDFETARLKRQELQIESRFYGALDGSMKFVKGDAIAGIVICCINIIGGLCVGLILHGMDIQAALSKYTILTVGDGLASQIPALLNSIAAGLIVTRVARGDQTSLASEVLSQFGQIREVKFFVAAICLISVFIPGVPLWPSLLLASILFSMSWLQKSEKLGAANHIAAPLFMPRTPPLLQIQLTRDCARLLASIPNLSDRIDRLRQKLYDQVGLIILRPDLAALQENSLNYNILVRGVVAYKGDFQRFANISALHLLDDILQQLEIILTTRAVEFVDDILTRRTLDYFDKEAPELVSSVVPSIVSITQLTFILKSLLLEQVPIKNMDLILQALSDLCGKAENERHMLEEVRIALKAVICEQNFELFLKAISLDSVIDLAFARSEKMQQVLEPEYAIFISEALNTYGPDTLLIVSRSARKLIKESLSALNCETKVIAIEEISKNIKVNRVGTIEINDEKLQERTLQQLAA